MLGGGAGFDTVMFGGVMVHMQAGGDDDSVKMGDVGGVAVDTAVDVVLTADTGNSQVPASFLKAGGLSLR